MGGETRANPDERGLVRNSRQVGGWIYKQALDTSALCHTYSHLSDKPYPTKGRTHPRSTNLVERTEGGATFGWLMTRSAALDDGRVTCLGLMQTTGGAVGAAVPLVTSAGDLLPMTDGKRLSCTGWSRGFWTAIDCSAGTS